LAARAARLLDRFGFSCTIAVLPRTVRKQGLDFLEFPWILSSESRLFNELRGILREENFSRPFAARQRAGTGAGILTMQKRSVAHRASLTHFLLFCNQLPATEIVDSLSSLDGPLSG
jgi:tRNA nucleotidyltransferase/poly(A) polymerase